MRWPFTPSLSGQHVRIQPLSMAHEAGLAEALRDGELWKLWYTRIPSPEALRELIGERLQQAEAGTLRPFTVFDAEGQVLGMTSFLNIDAQHRRLEIGTTWYRASAQRSVVNTECKFLLLAHAFESLDCIAVEFRTHRLNHRSRRAIERLGAQLDGVLRAHQRMADGSLRDTAVYSITATEWPTVKIHLQHLLQPAR